MENFLPTRNEKDTAAFCEGKDFNNVREDEGDSMQNNHFVFSTPLPRSGDVTSYLRDRKDCLSQCSKDSGFSDRTFLSAWTSSERDSPDWSPFPSTPASRSGVHASNKSETEGSEHPTISDDVSPVKHRSIFAIKGKRLTFATTELQSPLAELSKHEDTHNQEQISASHCSAFIQNKDNEVSAHANLVERPAKHSDMTAEFPLLQFSDDLDQSMQEMSLEESSSSSSSRSSPAQPLLKSCQFVYNPVEDTVAALPSSSAQSLYEDANNQQHSNGNIDTNIKKYISELIGKFTDKYTSTEQVNTLSQPSPSFVASQLNRTTTKSDLSSKVHCIQQGKEEFLSKLCLAPVQLEDHETSTHSQFPKHKKSAHLMHGHSAKYICQESQQLGSPSSNTCISNLQSLEGRVPPLPCHYALHSDLHSKPVSGNKDSVAHLDTFQNNYSANDIPIDHAGLKSPIKRSHSCDNTENHLLFSPTKARKTLPTGMIHSTCQETAHNRNSFKNVARTIFKEGEDSDVNFDRIGYSNEYLPDHLSQMRLSHCDTVLTVSEHVTEQADQDHSQDEFVDTSEIGHRNWKIATKVSKMISNCLPVEPSRLIGRNIGLRKFDIVHRLNLGNFIICLEKIFHYLDPVDLISVYKVSRAWRSALHLSHKAYGRYRQHMRDLHQQTVQHGVGKENCGEKPVDATLPLPLTASRGHLKSLQSQASRPHSQQPTTLAQPKATLLSEDHLRRCPRCQGRAVVKPQQDRATCMDDKCAYDFCTRCFEVFHHPKKCKPLYKAPSKAEVAGTRKSRKKLRRL